MQNPSRFVSAGSLPDRPNLQRLHQMQDAAIAAARREPPPPFAGDGMVMVAGGPRCFASAYISLSLLRREYRCRLPIQVWHLGRAEMTPVMGQLLRELDVEVVDAYSVRRRHPVRRLGPWECKVYALLRAPFRRILLLDADNMALADPAPLFDLPEFTETGTIFWADLQRHLEESPVWDLFRTPYRPEPEVESGQLLIDKAVCWVPLNLAMHFNEWSDVYFQYVYGDKETFHFAWRHLDAPYAMPGQLPRLVSCQRESPFGARRMTAALHQHDFAGEPIFHHRTGAEWMIDGANPDTGIEPLESRCRAALAELRSRWDGRVLPDPTPPPGTDRPRVLSTRCYLFRRVGVDERYVTFAPDGKIMVESGEDPHWKWRLDERRPEPRLILISAGGEAADMTERGNGIWRGRWRWYEQMALELLPLGGLST